MANQFSVQPLGGFNPGQAVAGLGQQFGDQMRHDKQEQEKQDLQAVTAQAMTGDPAAMDKLFSIDPRMGMMVDQRNQDKVSQLGAVQALESKKAETDWGLRWKQSQDPQQKEALLQEAMANPLIDIDDEDVGIDPGQADLAVNAMLYGHMGKDAYKDLLSGGQGTPMTAYQKELVKGGNADREIRKAEAENKRIDNQLKRETNQVKLDELKAKKIANEDKQIQIKKGRSDTAQSVVDSGSSTLDLINEIESHPGLEGAVGAKGVSSLFGALDSPISGTDEAGVNALIETLEAQNFLTAIGEFKSAGGAGSLSDNEGKKLGAALSNLSTSQNEKDFKKSLNVIRNLVKKQISKAAPQIEKRFTLDPSVSNKKVLSDEELLNKYGG